MRHWTQEERERQSELIKSWQPWQKSTGPQSDAGKAVAAKNAFKHGMRSVRGIKEQRDLNALLRQLSGHGCAGI